jgi:hypothetical protein
VIGTTTDDDPARELRRVVERLAGLSPQRLSRPGGDGRSPADLVSAELDALAVEAADLREDEHRDVPRLRPHALGDQLSVLVREALAAGVPAGEVATRLVRLRRSL